MNWGLARVSVTGRLVALGIAAVLAVCVPAGFAAARSGALGGSPPTQPDLSAMALSPIDLPAGAAVSSQGYAASSFFALYYKREFRSGALIGSSRVVGLVSEVGLATDFADATSLLADISAELKTKQGRMRLARTVLPGIKKFPKTTVTFGGSRSLGVGDESLEAELTVRTRGVRIPLTLSVVRVDRVVSGLTIVGSPNRSVARGDALNLSQKISGHIKTGLLPVNTAPPTISGIAQQGQTLTAGDGTWTNWTSGQTVYAIQWQRCDATGRRCSTIATGQTYVVTAADVGATLRVSVAASNPAGTSPAMVSAQTAVVI